jgi:hypothetical protein
MLPTHRGAPETGALVASQQLGTAIQGTAIQGQP